MALICSPFCGIICIFSLLQTVTGDSGVQQAAEGEVQERVHKKRKEKPSDKEGTSKKSC